MVYFFKVVIVIKDVNYNEIIKNIVESLKTAIKTFIDTAKYDKTFKAKVIGNLGNNNKYQILYKGKKYTVTSECALATDQIVRVCAPQNNWSELFVMLPSNSSGGGNGDIPSGIYVSGIKGENEIAYRTGNVNLTKDNLGLGKVENKSSQEIREDFTNEDMIKALGYTPLDAKNKVYESTVLSKHNHENKSILDTISEKLIEGWNKAFNNTHNHNNKNILDSIENIDSSLSEESINPVQNKIIFKALRQKASENHTHNYAGSDTSGGIANSSKKLETPRKINGVDFDGTKDIKIEAGDEIIRVTKDEYDNLLKNGAINEDKYYLVIDDEVNNLIAQTSGMFTLSMEGWDLVAYYNDDSTLPPISFDPDTWDIYYELPDENINEKEKRLIDG